MRKKFDLEVVTDSLEEALAADAAGVDRIELVSGFDLAGLTPSHALVAHCLEKCNAQIHAMIRPRAGNFCYSNTEFALMKTSIKQFADLGVHGVVFGVLNQQAEIDCDNTKMLATYAKSLGLQITCHRAFDFAQGWQKNLETLIYMGFDRVLTAGLAAKAILGIHNYPLLLAEANNQIQIMAGGGIDVMAASQLAQIPLNGMHFAIRKPLNKAEPHQNLLGQTFVTDFEKLSQIIAVCKAAQ